jgi:predicted membrane channel-forming protein YqfA (hemolysin III family)
MSTIQKEDQEMAEQLLCESLIASIVFAVLTAGMIIMSIIFDSLFFPWLSLLMFVLFFISVVIAMTALSTQLEWAIAEHKEAVRWNGILNLVIKGILSAPRYGKDPYRVQQEIMNSPR